MPIAEPCNLKEWSSPSGRLFTCSRPGRATYGTKKLAIPPDTIRSWIKGLPAASTLHLVSLLGWKKDGYSEFSYYPFRSEEEANAKPTMWQWMDAHAGRSIVVHEFPTEDRLPIAAEKLETATQAVESLVAAGAVVVVMDSAGSQRTGSVCGARFLVHAKAHAAMPVRDCARAAGGAVPPSQSNRPWRSRRQ